MSFEAIVFSILAIVGMGIAVYRFMYHAGIIHGPLDTAILYRHGNYYKISREFYQKNMSCILSLGYQLCGFVRDEGGELC